MTRKRTAIILLLITSAIITSATLPQQEDKKPEFKNLKVLPKKITRDELDQVMRHYNKSLGVKCNFCHAPAADGAKGLNFSSDAKEEKIIARSMMKMTNKLNQKNFGAKKDVHNQAVMQVSCNTCHRGKSQPSE